MPTTDTYSAADLVAVIPERWTPIVLEAFFDKTVAANFFLDLTDTANASGAGDIFHVANIFTNILTSAAKSNAAEVTLVSPLTVDVTITATTWRHVAYLIEDNEMQQTPDAYQLLRRLSEQAGSVLADDLEDNLLALWSGIATTVGTTSAAITDLQIRQAIRNVDDGPAPRDNRAFFFHPVNYWDQIIALAKYYDASISGRPSVIQTGNFGPMDRERGYYGVLYGDPVFITTNVVNNATAYRNLYAHRDAFGFITRTPGGNRVRMQSAYLLENLGILTVSDIIYGSAELRDVLAVVINGSTTATTA